jgi:hypothetical protein
MKRALLLLALAAIPLFAFEVRYIYNDGPAGRWSDEYWEYSDYGCDPGPYWIYYPHGHYCVYYVWWHPWYWDWYWDNCRWCHSWDWQFFACGYYVVWFEDGGWWWRPRYGREVRYKLPYEYGDFRWKARGYGVNLPDKPGREINVPYKENDVQRLMKDKDPDLYKRLEQENKSGNMEKIRKDYDIQVKKEIALKNDEYRKTVKTAPPDKFVPNRDDQYDKDKTPYGRTDDVGRKNDTRVDQGDKTGSEPNERYIRKPTTEIDDRDNKSDQENNGDHKIKKPADDNKNSNDDRDNEKRNDNKADRNPAGKSGR